MTKQTKELAVIDFEKFSIAQLPELQGKKEEIASVIKANPIVEIVDNSTYELAKKSRTAVKTKRTATQSEQKDVRKKIKEYVLDVVDAEYDNLVEELKSAEKERQDPIDTWETKKEEERLEKLRLEELRVKQIKDAIQTFKDAWIETIDRMLFDGIENFFGEFKKVCDDFYRSKLAEYEVLFDDAILVVRQMAEVKIKTLTEQEQIRIDNLLIQEKNAESYRIQDWQRVWNTNIDTLSFDDLKDVKSVLVKSKLADLKHYSNEYEQIYTSTEKRLHSQIELISKAEEQRIAQEKFLAEKKEFEEKQAEAKFQERKKFLVDEDYWRIYLLAECGNFESNARLKLLAYTDESFEDFKLAVLKAKEPVVSETIETYENYNEEGRLIEKDGVLFDTHLNKIHEPSNEIIKTKVVVSGSPLVDYHEADVDAKGVVKTDSFVERMIPIVEKQNLEDLKEMQNEISSAKTHDFANYQEEVQHIEKVTESKVQGESVFDVEKIECQIWDNIHKEWHTDFHGMTFLEYLKEFYHAPTKKQ
jgi:hypothetical protein